MTLTRKQRIAVEVLGPPFLGLFLIELFSMMQALWLFRSEGHFPDWDWHIFAVYGVGLIFAYLIAGIPSLLYMLIMEWRFARELSPRSWRSAGLSSFLGALSGYVLITAAFGSRSDLDVVAAGAGLGLAVGFLLGFFIKITGARTHEAVKDND